MVPSLVSAAGSAHVAARTPLWLAVPAGLPIGLLHASNNSLERGMGTWRVQTGCTSCRVLHTHAVQSPYSSISGTPFVWAKRCCHTLHDTVHHALAAAFAMEHPGRRRRLQTAALA